MLWFMTGMLLMFQTPHPQPRSLPNPDQAVGIGVASTLAPMLAMSVNEVFRDTKPDQLAMISLLGLVFGPAMGHAYGGTLAGPGLSHVWVRAILAGVVMGSAGGFEYDHLGAYAILLALPITMDLVWMGPVVERANRRRSRLTLAPSVSPDGSVGVAMNWGF